MIQQGFGKDGSGGISGTKKQHVVRGRVHGPQVQQGSPTQPGGQSHQVVSFELCRGFLTSID
jgi:hypothetical protein